MDFITYMKGLKPQNKMGAAFGSYGWTGEGVPMMTDRLKSLKLTVVEEGLRFKFVPNEEKFKKRKIVFRWKT